MLDAYEEEANKELGLPPFRCIVLERGDMSLEDLLADRAIVMDDMNKRNLLHKIVKAVHALHSHRIIHRDLKPGNFIVFTKHLLTVKLIDLGSACLQGEESKIEYTPRYAAPEMVLSHSQDASIVSPHLLPGYLGTGTNFLGSTCGRASSWARIFRRRGAFALVTYAPLRLRRYWEC